MNHFFAKKDAFTADMHTVTLRGDTAHHIARVLRLKVADEISLSVADTEDPARYRYEITSITDSLVTGNLLFVQPADVELSAKIVLYQALPKMDKMEWIIQKAVELGVYRIVPVQTARCIGKLPEMRMQKKLDRWQKIAESAAEQSRRAIIPAVGTPLSFVQALSDAATLDHILLPYELAQEGMTAADAMAFTRSVIQDIKPNEGIGIFIGPEGGFTAEEVTSAEAKGARIITLGRRILRTETAGMALLSRLMFHLE